MTDEMTMNLETTPQAAAAEAVLPLADYAEQIAGKSLRTVQRWLEKDELPGAQQDEDGRWWVPATARRRTSSRDVVAPAPATSSHDVVPVTQGPPIGHGGSLEEFAALVGFSPRGVRRLYADMRAAPGLPLYVGRYRPHGAMAVYVTPR